MNLLELQYQRRNARKEAAGLLDTAVLECRALTAIEQTRFDVLAARIDELGAAIEEREALRMAATR